jgi:acyl-coenzyme A thioesterase PaaI-like protein
MMRLLGAELGAVAPGHVTVVLPFRFDLTKQHGYVHAAAATAIAADACGYATNAGHHDLVACVGRANR